LGDANRWWHCGHDVSCPYGNAGNDRIVAVPGMAMGNVAALTAMLAILNLYNLWIYPIPNCFI
jgi:hypothetical protein